MSYVSEEGTTGATGDPTQASKEVGELFWETFRTNFAKMLAEVSQGTFDV
jgi:creatinine amidohydrolase/Fe(II)-dependent formamide hydrolase-like protein